MGEAMIRGRRTRINYAKDWQYTTNDTATLVTKYIGNKTDVVVPSKINGKPVVMQNSASNTSGVFTNNRNIKSVKFSEGVGVANNDMSWMFSGCSNLVEAPVIPSNVTILYDTFQGCYDLINAPVIPSNVTNMAFTFKTCFNLVNIVAIPEKVTNMCGTFDGCSSLINVPDIPVSVTDVNSTFDDCRRLINAPVIHASVTDMTNTFQGCSNLINAPVIPASVTEMCGTFSGCANLVNAPIIPATVTNMSNTFKSCLNLVNISDLSNVVGVKNMTNTFNYCVSLINAPVIPINVTDMSSTFANCQNLINAPTIPANVTNVCSTFCNCRNLVNAPILPANVINVVNTFRNCTNLTGNIHIKSNRINNTSMRDCFFDTTLPKNVYIPSRGYNPIANTWKAAFNTTYGINGKNGVTVIDDAALDWTYTTNDTATLLTKYTGTKADVTVPTTLAAKPTMLSTAVFKGTSVNSVDLSGVNFANLNMANAFNGCTNLKSVKNTSVYINQANDAFHGCTNLTGVYAQNVTGGYEGSLGEIHNAVNMFRNCYNMTRVPDFDSLATDSTNKANYSRMFDNCYKLQSYTIGSIFSHYFLKLDTVDMSYMYANCQSLGWSNSMGLALYGNTNASHAFDNTGFKYLGQMTDPNYEESTSKLSLTYTNLNASYMFANCKNMVVADFQASGAGSANFAYAFSNCQNLTDVKNIPNGITSANYMFSNCRKLVNISAFKNDIRAVAFMCQNCTSLKNAVEISDGVTSMWATYVNCTNLTNVPITAISLGAVDMDGTFSNCRNLVTAPIIPPNVTSMSSTFTNCANLTGNVVIYTDKMRSYPSTFSGTTKAKNVYIYNTNTTSNMWNVWNNTSSGVNGKNGVTLINMGTWENTCWTYTTSGTNTLVTKYKGTPNDVYVPKVINGRNTVLQNNVNYQSGVFTNNRSITRVKFDSNVNIATGNMYYIFYNCRNLVNAPVIPVGVTNMQCAFSSCISLINAPIIPANVTNMAWTFQNCYNLIKSPVIPANVTNMCCTLENCTNLIHAPEIPANVTYMARTFQGCYNLVNAPFIPANVTSLSNAFHSCRNLINAPVIPEKVTNMANTFENCYGIVNAPIIPVNVTNMINTFRNCTSLTGNIRIMSNRINNISMQNCFNGTSKTKNVYIPFTGYNSVANTHNAAINSAYGINGKNGVTIYDINTYTG